MSDIWERRFRWLVPNCSDGWQTPDGWVFGAEAQDPDKTAEIIDKYLSLEDK